MATTTPDNPPRAKSGYWMWLVTFLVTVLTLCAIIFGPFLVREARLRQIVRRGVNVVHASPEANELSVNKPLRRLPGFEHWGLKLQGIVIESPPHSSEEFSRLLEKIDQTGGPLAVDLSASQHLKDDLTRLKKMRVKSLCVAGQNLDAASLHIIGKFDHLIELNMVDCTFENGGLAELGGLKHLEYISLDSATIDDQGLAHLQKITSLQSLSLSNTQVSETAKEGLIRAVPDLNLADD